LIIAVWGWALAPVSIAHTVVLVWESWATMEIISSMNPLQASQKVVGSVVLSAVWMLVTVPVWQ
jgi:hypothetical protein